MQLTTRNADLTDLAALLKDEHARKVDMVVPADKITSHQGLIRVFGADAVIDEEGVTKADGLYRPTAIFDEGLSSKLGIPMAYLRRMRETRPDLLDANVNGWLRGYEGTPWLDPETGENGADGATAADERAFLLRTYRRDDETGEGIARAFLSDRYARIDNLDAMTAALQGVRESGVDVTVTGCDLTERRMQIRVDAPGLTALAPTLLKGYRSPFTGQSGDDLPVVSAGLVISNSETGNGAFTITPRFTVLVCKNGMTITRDATKRVHLGGKLDDGIIRWSEATQRTAMQLVRAKTVDSVRTFLDIGYMTRVLAQAEERAGEPVATVDEVTTLTKGLSFTEEQINGVLSHFIQGGQMTRGGVFNAITSYSQTVEDADTAADLEEKAPQLLSIG